MRSENKHQLSEAERPRAPHCLRLYGYSFNLRLAFNLTKGWTKALLCRRRPSPAGRTGPAALRRGSVGSTNIRTAVGDRPSRSRPGDQLPGTDPRPARAGSARPSGRKGPASGAGLGGQATSRQPGRYPGDAREPPSGTEAPPGQDKAIQGTKAGTGTPAPGGGGALTSRVAR